MTVFCGQHFIINIYVITFISLASLYYYLNYRPFSLQLFNQIEVVNDLAILFSSYFLYLFSDWIDDPELKYTIGWAFFYFFILVLFGNIFVIFI